MDGILASIFQRFSLILGAKLGGKTEPRSTQEAIENIMENESQQDAQKIDPRTANRGYDHHRPQTFWTQIVAGGSPPTRRANPHPLQE